MNELSIVTYNILADAYIKPDRYPNSPPEALDPSTRHPLLLAQLERADADIYCLQEVEPALFTKIVNRLDGFAGSHCQAPDRPDGLAFVWRCSAVHLESSESLGDPELGRGNALTAHIGHFRVGDRALGIANMHLRWRPDDTPDSEHTGLIQLRRVLDFCESQDTGAWVLAGDFNANSQSRVLTEAEARGHRISCRAQRPWDTTNINGRRRKIDYLLHDPALLQPTPGLLPKLERRTPMPSAIHPSDHLPLQVGFSFR